MKKIAAALTLCCVAVATQAVPVGYEGTLISSLPATGSVGGFAWFLDQGAGVDYWRFSASAGDRITLRVDRLNGNLDPALSLYRGITTADTSAFNSGADWGGMTFVGSLDDENPAFLLPGPAGDPFGSFTIGSAGNYTVAVGGGSASTDAGSYPYRITMTLAPIPEPTTSALLGLGLATLVWLRRRVRR